MDFVREVTALRMGLPTGHSVKSNVHSFLYTTLQHDLYHYFIQDYKTNNSESDNRVTRYTMVIMSISSR